MRRESFVPAGRWRTPGRAGWTSLADSEIHAKAPLRVLRDVLPEALATELLLYLMHGVSWERGTWIVQNKEHTVPRATAQFALCDPAGAPGAGQQRAPPVMREAARRIADVVAAHRPWGEAWVPTFAFGNRYENGREGVGFHADHIMKLGPRPVIVGLSLGSCRRFDLREEAGERMHVSVPLPHNSIAIMLDDAQERWQHSVPTCSDGAITRHARAGLVRYSLTFRQERELPDLGRCHCGEPAALKAKNGEYILFCRPYGKASGRTCSFRRHCEWAAGEAARLRALQEDHAARAAEQGGASSQDAGDGASAVRH